MKTKGKVGRSKHSNKRRNKKYYALIKKRHTKSEKYITPMDFAEHLRKSDFWENRKVYDGPLLRNGLQDRYCYIVNVDEMCNILKSASHCLLVERWRWNWMIKIFAGVCPWMSISLIRHLLRGRLRLVRDTAAEKEFDIAI